MTFTKEITNNDESIPLILLNARSVKNKQDKLEQSILGFPSLPIVLVCETWLACNDSNMLLPCANCFTIYRADRDRAYGGVAILIPKQIPSMLVDKPLQCNEFESVWCRLVLKHGENVDIGMYYRPPRPSNRMMPNKLMDHLNKVVTFKHPTIIAGDFNYPGIEWCNNTPSHQNGQNVFLNYMNDAGFTQLVTFPTRNNNTLDLLLTNEVNLVQNVELGPKLSDHESITATINILSTVVRKTSFRDYKRANFDAANNAIQALNWNAIFHNKQPDQMWSAFMDHISHISTTSIILSLITIFQMLFKLF